MKEVLTSKRVQVVEMMFSKNQDGTDMFSQREIERQTGLSRLYIRKLAEEVGHKFPQNGVEVVAPLNLCTFCGCFFRKSRSRIIRVENPFCSVYCKAEFQRGENNPNFTGGKASTFSMWITQQNGYKKWKKEALEKAGYKCQISGLTTDLDVHHLRLKSFDNSMALDPNNALVVNKEIHRMIHSLIHSGVGFQEAVEQLKQKYSNSNNKGE